MKLPARSNKHKMKKVHYKEEEKKSLKINKIYITLALMV